MTIRTPNWESGRIILPKSRTAEIIKAVEEAMPIHEDNNRHMNIEWPLLVGISGSVVYWQVQPHEKHERTKEYLTTRLKIRQALDMIKRWPSNTGGAISGEVGFIQAYGPRGTEAEKLYKEASKDVTKQFAMLKSLWYQGTKNASLKETLEHPAHEKIVGLGSEILPLIMKEVEADHGWWFTTLKVIAGENPEQPGYNLTEKKQAWIDWWKGNG